MSSSPKIAIVGAGVIGAGWAAHFLARGFKVSAMDPAAGAEARLRAWVNGCWPAVEKLGLAEGASLENLSFSTDVAETVRDAFFIQESGPERLEVKRLLMAAIEASAPPGALVASSTSGLLISEIQEGATRPERIVLGHPFNPPHLIPLVEVGGGKLTSAENVTKAIAFYASTGKKPLRMRQEVKGHVANRLQVALWREAFSLALRGVASVEDIDTAISYGPGLRWALLGPFLNLHSSGGPGGITHTLEHLGPALREWAGDLGTYPETDDFVKLVAEGVNQELKGHDFTRMLQQRDELLAHLIAVKKQSSQIP